MVKRSSHKPKILKIKKNKILTMLHDFTIETYILLVIKCFKK